MIAEYKKLYHLIKKAPCIQVTQENSLRYQTSRHFWPVRFYEEMIPPFEREIGYDKAQNVRIVIISPLS